GGKSALAAGQDNRADGRVALEAVERRAELANQRVAKRVERLRPIERDEADGAAGFDEDVLVTHRDCSVRSGESVKPTASLLPAAEKSSVSLSASRRQRSRPSGVQPSGGRLAA